MQNTFREMHLLDWLSQIYDIVTKLEQRYENTVLKIRYRVHKRLYLVAKTTF